MNSKSRTIKNLFFLFKQQRKLFVVFTLIIILTAVLEAAGIGLLYPIINVLGNESEKLTYVEHTNNLLHSSIGAEQFVIILFVVVLTIFLMRGLFLIASSYFQYKLSQTLVVNWQTKTFSSYLSQKYDYFIKHQTGDLIQKQMAHTEMAGNAILYSCQIAKDLFTAMFLYATLCVISLKGALFSLILMLILTTASLVLSKIKIYVASEEHARLQKQAYSIASEVITGIRQVKVFLAEEFFKKLFSDTVTKKARIYRQNATLGQVPGPIMQTVVLLSLVSVLFFITRYSENTQDLFPLVSVFGAAIYRIGTSLAGVNSNFMQIAHLLPSVNIVSGLVRSAPRSEGFHKIICFNNGIRFEDVTFAYSREGFNLFNININFKKGKFYGIVGASGSGKSTLTDLIIKFYSPQKGKILVDGQDLEKADARSWRKQIGLISQETFIFNTTIEENISFATEASEFDREKVVKAAKIADIHDFVTELPGGYQSIVGERGLKLSGGQRQRLAIARAVYRDPEIYIFDEATSSLDTYSEKKIQQSIENLSQSKTVIAIAHRLSTIINADEILVMKEGKIIERGSHSELLEQAGYYAELYANQHSTNSVNKK